MRVIGSGAFGVVLTDNKNAYKYLTDDPHSAHFARTFEALCCLAGSGVGEGVRPAIMRLGPSAVPVPVFRMPLYGDTIYDRPLTPRERGTFDVWLRTTAWALSHRGVCHRDFSRRNIARGPAGLVLIDLDAAFVTARAPELRPEEGLYSPWYGYPRDVLHAHDMHVAYRVPVVELTMWFSATVCYNVSVLHDAEIPYTPAGRPANYFGRRAVAERIVAMLSSWPHITPLEKLQAGIYALLS